MGPLFCQTLPWETIESAAGVIAVRANKQAHNYRLMVRRRTAQLNLAWWGHAYNYQGNRDSSSERLKQRLAREADWWFSYMPESAGYLSTIGFDPSRITIIENSIGVSEFDDIADVARHEKEIRSKWGISPESICGIFSGSLYRDKRLDFLIASIEVARNQRPDLELIIIGQGPLQKEVEAWSKSRQWLHYFGSRYGREKAELFAVSKFVLNPGLVGLGIIDSFASGRPLLTTDCGIHSPEIGYLKSGVNGLMTVPNVSNFADAIVGLMQQPNYLDMLVRGALAAGQIHTVTRMAEGTAAGICKWLERS